MSDAHDIFLVPGQYDSIQTAVAAVVGSNVLTNAGYAARRARGGGIWCEASRMRMWKSRVTDNVLVAADCAGAGMYVRESVRCDLGGSTAGGIGRHCVRRASLLGCAQV